MKFKILNVLFILAIMFISSLANAGLISRLGGLAYYDDVADLTWLADANYAKTSGYSYDGRMTWVDANSWAVGLNVGGNNNWRLADTLRFDVSCNTQTTFASYGDWCAGSEMGSLFYSALGTVTGQVYVDRADGPFKNIQDFTYWSATQRSSGNTLVFDMNSGRTGFDHEYARNNAWAVQTGDVAKTVPEPSTLAIFVLGMVGLASRRFRNRIQ